MEKLINGVQQFQSNVFASLKSLFERLDDGQQPETLFITCSDSRVSPNLLTQTMPGDLFVIRNAGNMVPAYSPTMATGEGATLEYAVQALGIKEIIVCGHAKCGAMGGLLKLDELDSMPTVKAWLGNAASTLSVVKQMHPDATGPELLTRTIEANVLAQIDNLKTHPCVAAAVAAGKLKLTGWVYNFATGDVFEFDAKKTRFASVTDPTVELIA